MKSTNVKFFKPEDFKYISKELCEDAANCANAKLEREGEVVYNFQDSLEYGWFKEHKFNNTHKALVINIEPVVKCDHAKEKVKRTIDYSYNNTSYKESWHCECGVEVSPTAFEERKPEKTKSVFE